MKAPKAEAREVHHVTMRSGKMTWQTPQWFLDMVRAVAPIACDPATTAANPTRAAVFFTLREDGLLQAWPLVGMTFVNPPYGRHLEAWSKRIAEHPGEGLVLVPSRTETKWWTRLHGWCDWKLLWSSPYFGPRIGFVDADTGESGNGAGFPSTLFYRGPNARRFLEVFGPHGDMSPGPRILGQLMQRAIDAGYVLGNEVPVDDEGRISARVSPVVRVLKEAGWPGR